MASELDGSPRRGGGDIQVIARVGQILDLLTTARPTLRTAEVAAELGLQRTTVHRYLASMTRARLLARTDGGSVTPGALLVKVGALAIGGRKVVQLARPFMQRLAAETGQTVVLSLWGGHGPVVALVEEDRTRAVRIVVSVGYALRIDSSQAIVFLAHLSDRVLAARLIDQLPAGVAEDIRAKIARAREDGVAVFTSTMEGLRAVAAPVFDVDGICAAVALLGTTAGIPAEPTSPQAQALRDTAEELSGSLQVSVGFPATAVGPAR